MYVGLSGVCAEAQSLKIEDTVVARIAIAIMILIFFIGFIFWLF
jgi:hypothetical protein